MRRRIAGLCFIPVAEVHGAGDGGETLRAVEELNVDAEGGVATGGAGLEVDPYSG